MLGNLFLDNRAAEDIEQFAARLFEMLGIAPPETRYSDNVFGGKYCQGFLCGFEVMLENADYAEFTDYPFLLSFAPARPVGDIDVRALDGFADLLARYLASHGMRVARPDDLARVGTPWVEYGAKEGG